MPVEFSLDGGVSVRILKKTRALTGQEIADLSNVFLKLYPGRTDLFQIMQIQAPSSIQPEKQTFSQKIKAQIKKVMGTEDIKGYFRQKLGGSDITGLTSY